MNEDFLLIVLKDLLSRRRDLRLILMSATLNAELFSSYFGGAPTIHIPGFTHPVRAHFLEGILERTGYKLSSTNQLDDYGQDKVWKTQRQLLPRKRKNQITTLVEDTLKNSSFETYGSRTRDSLANWNPDCIGFNLIEAVLCHICRKERPGAVLVFMTRWDDISCLRDQLKAHPLLGDPNRVLLLACHGSMATSEQRLIFEKPPPNVRKVVLATNMAEASITINDIVFVVDCGKAKETTYNALNNTPCLLPSWISKASARQVVNVEWGSFRPPQIPLTPYDICFNDEKQDYYDQGFEKMISGVYLGEIARLVFQKMAHEFGTAVDGLATPFMLSTPCLAAIRDDASPDLREVGRILEEHLKIWDVPLKARRLVQRVCDIVTRRAARLAAAGIVAILQKIGRDGTLCGTNKVRRITGVPKRSIIAIEGGLYQGYSVFREYLNEAVGEILGEEIVATVSLRVTEEGSGIGAALLAATYSSNIRK